MKSSEVGGQAVIEGVMMKNKDKYAVAVRKSDGSIVVDVKKTGKERDGILKAPIIRGVVAFVDSMVIGIKTLSFSASFFDEEEEEAAKKTDKASAKEKQAKNEKANDKKTQKNKSVEETHTEIESLDIDEIQVVTEQKSKQEKVTSAESNAGTGDKLLIAGTVAFSIVLSVAIFMLLPMFLSRLLGKVIDSQFVLTVIEGGLRIIIFLAYVVAISQVNDIKRVFCYHGAEHKSINCIENGLDLTVENVRGQARLHKRCGTSFMLFVVFISLIFFLFIRVDQIWLQALIRVLLMPLIAGISYEIIRLAGRSDNKFVAAISKPGFMLQNLTTREPDDSMIECAIASVEAVFDWRKFVAEVRNEQGQEASVATTEQETTSKEVVVDEEQGSVEFAATAETAPATEEVPAKPAPAEEPNLSALDKVLTVNKEEKLEFKDPLREREAPKISIPTEDDEILQALDKFFVFEDKDD